MNEPVKTVPLTLTGINSPDALLALGALAARALLERAQICFFLAKDGEVCLAPIFEVHLDAVLEETAITTLLNLGYDHNRLKQYLRGRDARLAHAKAEFTAQAAKG